MITAGVTGGIGSGKTTVCRWWSEWGAYVLHADPLAKELMVNDPQLRQDLQKAFGKATYHKDGSLNKPHLIREAFQNDRVEELNALVHPVVHRVAREQMEQAEKDGVELFVYEAALLLKEGRPPFIDKVVLMLADEQRRIQRVARRDEQQAEDIRARIKKQQNFEHLADQADYVIRNNGTLKELRARSREIFEELVHIIK